MKNKIPATYKSLFWDYNINSINLLEHKSLIIERLLEKGSVDSLQWIFEQYPKQEIIRIVEKSPNISSKTRNFWNIVLDEN